MDGLVREHFQTCIEDQLRGRIDNLGTSDKYLRTTEHRQFLNGLAHLNTELAIDLERFKNTRLPSLRFVFQAYLNSLGIYHTQSKNLVIWDDALRADQSGKHRWPRCRACKQSFVPIREGNIDDYNQAYQFMELCKNNLLKEFSIWELSQTADTLAGQVTRLRRDAADLRHEAARQRDSLTTSLALLRQTNALLQSLEKRAILTQSLQDAFKNARSTRRRVVLRFSKKALSCLD